MLLWIIECALFISCVLGLLYLGYRLRQMRTRCLSLENQHQQESQTLRTEFSNRARLLEQRNQALMAAMEKQSFPAASAESLDEPACLWMPTGQHLWSNSAWNALIGPLSAQDFATRIDSPSAQQVLDAIGAQGKFEETLRLKNSEGIMSHLKLRLTPASQAESAAKGCCLAVLWDNTGERLELERVERQVERFRRALGAGQIGIWEWWPAANRCVWDEQARLLFGAEASATNYEEWMACIHRADLPALETHLRSALLGYTQFDISVRISAGDVPSRHLGVRGTVQRDNEGKPIRILGLVSDVSDAIATNQQLRLTSERLRLSLIGDNSGVWEWNIARDCFSLDQSWITLTGETDVSKVSRQAFEARLHPEDLSLMRAALEAKKRGAEELLDLECRVALSDDNWAWLRWKGTITSSDSSGRALVLSGTYADVTEKHRNEDALRSSALLLRQMCQQMGIAAWELNVSTFSLNWTEELDLLHFAPPDFEPSLSNVLELYPQDARRELSRAIEHSIERNEPMDIEVRWQTSGLVQNKWYRWIGQPVSTKGRVESLCGLIQDVSADRDSAAQRRELDSRLAELHQYEILSAVTDDLAYDLNSLLSSLLGFQELACDELPVEHKARSFILEAMRTSNRTHDIIRQVLLLNRVKPAARIGLRPHLLVDEVCEQMSKMLPNSISIERDIDRNCPPISGDASQLQQAFVHAASQAASALLGRQASLAIRMNSVAISLDDAASMGLTMAGDFVHLEIAALLKGLQTEEWIKLFSHPSRDPGMHLTSARKVISEHEGVMRTTCDPEKGGVCEFWIPLQRTLQSHPPSSIAVLQGSGESLWIIDEERFITRLCKLSLERNGYAVLAMHTPAECLEALREHPQDCNALLLGSYLPGVNIREFINSARRLRPNLPVIALGAHRVLEGTPHCQMLPEPFTATDLYRAAYDAVRPTSASMGILET